jgi:hypothetical protein
MLDPPLDAAPCEKAWHSGFKWNDAPKAEWDQCWRANKLALMRRCANRQIVQANAKIVAYPSICRTTRNAYKPASINKSLGAKPMPDCGHAGRNQPNSAGKPTASNATASCHVSALTAGGNNSNNAATPTGIVSIVRA